VSADCASAAVIRFSATVTEEKTMPSVTITKGALDAISNRRSDSPSVTVTAPKPIPLLAWSERSYFDDSAGHRTELGPQFYFCWTDDNEIEANKYFTLDIALGGKLALAPGELFRSGSHLIDLKDGRLSLTTSS
jgi:hypothetical protein